MLSKGLLITGCYTATRMQKIHTPKKANCTLILSENKKKSFKK